MSVTSDVEMTSAPAPRERTVVRRAATKVQKYKDGSDESSDSEPELLDNKIDSDREVPEPMSDEDFTVKKNNKKPAEMDSDCLFDSLIEDTKKEESAKNNEPIPTTVLSSDDETVQETAPKKKQTKRKLMNVEKDKPKARKRPAKVVFSQSTDEEDDVFDTKKAKKKANPKKRQKKADSDSSCEEVTRGRDKDKVYRFSDGSDSDL